MTPAEFKRKWACYSGKETAAYQEHFNDLCALLDQPTPATADPTGSESFCFQKRVVKDAELFALAESDRVAEEPEAERERGFADVWKKGCFAWEYKGKKKNLDAAYQQLLRYRESLLNRNERATSPICCASFSVTSSVVRCGLRNSGSVKTARSRCRICGLSMFALLNSSVS